MSSRLVPAGDGATHRERAAASRPSHPTYPGTVGYATFRPTRCSCPGFARKSRELPDRLGGSRPAGQLGRRRPARHAIESGHGILVRTCTLPPSRAAHPGRITRITPWARRPGRWYKRGVDQLKATVRAKGSYTLVTLAGESDATTRQSLRDFLESEVSKDVRRLII